MIAFPRPSAETPSVTHRGDTRAAACACGGRSAPRLQYSVPVFFRPARRAPALSLSVLTAALLLAANLSPAPSRAAEVDALTLDQAIELAARQNPEILKARASIEAATGRKLQAESFADPRLIYEPEEARNFSPDEFGSQKIGVSQSFELFGKRGLRGRIAASEVESARQAWRRAAMLTAARVKRAYWRAAAQRDIVARLESTGDLLRGMLEDTRIKFEGGGASYADVARAKVEIAKLEIDLSDARAELATDRIAINLLLGRPGNTPLELASAMKFSTDKRSHEEIRGAALVDRPALLIAEEERKKAEESRRLARRSYLPDLDVTGSYQRLRSDGAEGVSVDHDWSGVVELSFPFPGAKRQRGLVREAEAERQRAIISREAARRDALAATDRAYTRLKAAEEQLHRIEISLLPDADDALHSGIEAYRLGEIDFLSLLDLYRTYHESQIAYTRSLLAALTAQADLEVAGEESGEAP